MRFGRAGPGLVGLSEVASGFVAQRRVENDTMAHDRVVRMNEALTQHRALQCFPES